MIVFIRDNDPFSLEKGEEKSENHAEREAKFFLQSSPQVWLSGETNSTPPWSLRTMERLERFSV